MIPKHISIIPDGNRRWAKSKGISKFLAHAKAGSKEHLVRLFEAAKKEGVKVFSIWAFSTENWKRNKLEVKDLFNVIERGLDSCIAEKKKYFFKVIGRRDRIPKSTLKKIEELESGQSSGKEMKVILAVDYGGRDEIIRAVNKGIDGGHKLDEKSFLSLLDTESIQEPDLIIRTGGEKRLSGFMPYQTTYSEIIFLDTLFPDFSPKDLKKCLDEYSQRKRRFGS